MREEMYHLTLDRYDKNIILNALNNLRNNQVKDERPTEPIDEIIIKVSSAPYKKIKCVRDYNEER